MNYLVSRSGTFSNSIELMRFKLLEVFDVCQSEMTASRSSLAALRGGCPQGAHPRFVENRHALFLEDGGTLLLPLPVDSLRGPWEPMEWLELKPTNLTDIFRPSSFHISPTHQGPLLKVVCPILKQIEGGKRENVKNRAVTYYLQLGGVFVSLGRF